METVSVNIVTRNRSSDLRVALKTVCTQTCQVYEIVVVDNASTDETVKMLASEFPAVRVIRMHRNIGCQPARNIGMANCRGTVIFNLDDDGRLEPNAIQNLVTILTEHPEVGLVAAAVQVESSCSTQYANFNDVTHPFYSAFFIGAAHAIRREVLLSAGYFPEYVRGYSEPDLALRVIDNGWMILCAPNVVMYHDISPNERSEGVHTYYFVWHELETACRLEPLSFALAHCLWRITVGGVHFACRGLVFPFLKGILRFLYELPRTILERKPVSCRTIALYNYLLYHRPKNLEEIPDLNHVSPIQAIRWKFRPS